MKSVLVTGRNSIVKINRNILLSITLFSALLIIVGCGSVGSDGGSGSLVSSNETSSVNPAPSNDPPTNPPPENDPPPSELKSVQLQWDAPSTSENGSALTDLAGYKIHYGRVSRQYTKSANIGKFTTARISSLTTGLWCFAVQAYDISNNQSKLSDEVCATL